LAPKDVKAFNNRTGGRYGGLGMLIEQRPDKSIAVVTVYPNTPAEAGGIREGDRIIMVDTLSTAGWNISQVSDFLTGTPGTKVNATFARAGVATPIKSTFTRAIIHVPAIPFTLLLGPDPSCATPAAKASVCKVGYIPLQAFNENAADNLLTALKDLRQQGVKGFVIDERGNPGGILDQSLSIANMFLQEGQEIASMKGRDASQEQHFKAKGAPVSATQPLIVLTNDNTASASEIVAGALQDHDRALVLGQTSFGKGLVQSVYTLDGGYALKITTAKWFTPSGRSIQRPRKFVNGQFIEDMPDSNETETSKKARPAFKSDAGRTVFGGGGITPDVIVQEDTFTTSEQQLARALAPKGQEVRTVIDDYATQLAKTVTPTYTVQPAWLDDVFKRFQSANIPVDRKQFDAGSRYVSQFLDARIAHFAFGDSTAKRRRLQDDAPLRRAVALIDRASTQRDLFAAAGEPLMATQPSKPAVTKKP
jgi:carboxyl-terminal processing protease